LSWGSFLTVASARVVRYGLFGVVGVDLAGDPWTVACYLLPANHGYVGLLSVDTGRAAERVLSLSYRKVAFW